MLSALFSLLSCSEDTGVTISTGKIDVAFSVSLSDPMEKDLHTRALYSDTGIDNIDLLVFNESNQFMERIRVDAAELTTTSTGVNFTVQLDATPNSRTFHLIANGRTPGDLTERVNFGLITGGMAESSAIPALATNSLASLTGTTALLENMLPLVMWSRVSSPNINVTTSVTGVRLLRAAACIKVLKGTGINDNETFTLKRICLAQASDQGYIAPAAYSAAPTAAPVTGNPFTIGTHMDYSKTFSEASATPVVYVYEKNCTADNYTAVIIEADWKGRTGYYKVAMIDDNGQLINIVRNHRYNITVTGVYGYGYQNVSTAVSSAPSNDLKVSVSVDGNQEYPSVLSDGQYTMGITGNSVLAYGRRNEQTITTAVELCRVYSSRGVTPGNFITSNSPAWLTNLAATPAGTNIWKITADLAYASSLGANVSTVLTMCCDNLSHNLDVAWFPHYNPATDTASLLSTDNVNWKVSVPEAPSWVWLHPSIGTTGHKDGGLVHELSSKYHSGAYMHVHSGTTDRRAELSLSFSVKSTNEAIVKKIIVIQ